MNRAGFTLRRKLWTPTAPSKGPYYWRHAHTVRGSELKQGDVVSYVGFPFWVDTFPLVGGGFMIILYSYDLSVCRNQQIFNDDRLFSLMCICGSSARSSATTDELVPASAGHVKLIAK